MKTYTFENIMLAIIGIPMAALALGLLVICVACIIKNVF